MPTDPHDQNANADSYRAGLRMAHPPDPAALARERAYLAELDRKPVPARLAGYLKLSGPGYLQSAMTLGGGTAASALFAGAVFGYALLWVAPVAMILGLIMLSAVSYQTLSTGTRPFDAMRRHAGGFFAWGWAIGAILASIIWHFPQYALAAAALVDISSLIGVEGISAQVMGFIVLAWAIAISFMYGTSNTLVRWYERLLKYMVWAIVACFAFVVIRLALDGRIDGVGILRGFFTFEVPGTASNGIAGVTLIISGLAAAVGINMVFLYPYSLLARGWSREHRGLSRFDLISGMFVPYVIAASLMLIAAAATIYGSPDVGTRLSPMDASAMLTDYVGGTGGRIVFDIGILGMALSTITLHMICAGFVCSEVFGWSVGSWKYRIGTLLPAVGVFGPVVWSDIAIWLAVPTNIVCGLFLPVAYIGFVLLQRNRTYLGEDTPRGGRGTAWLGAMVFVTVFMTAFLIWYAVTKGPGYFETLGPKDEPSVQVQDATDNASQPE